MNATVRSDECSSSVSRQSRLADSESSNTVISESGVPSLETSQDADVLAKRWKEALAKCKEKLDRKDYEAMEAFESAEALLRDLNQRQNECQQSSWISRCAYDVLPALKAVNGLSALFTSVMFGSVETAMIWGVLHLTIKLSLAYEQRWQRMVDMLDKIRRKLTLLNSCAKCFDAEDDTSEIRAALVDVLVALMTFWAEAVKWCQQHPVEKAAKEAWLSLNEKFDKTLAELHDTTRHLQDLAYCARFSDPRAPTFLPPEALAQLQTNDETTSFPCILLPFPQSYDFYGREDVLKDIDEHLRPTQDHRGLRTLTIHGIGGIGKTQISLAYAHHNKSVFDAIFWIRGETTSSLKASFTEVAVALELSGTRRGTDENHENNFLLVQAWLRKESNRANGRKWLLIFDNVEDFSLLRKYWPSCAGSVLMTTRYQHIATAAGSSSKRISTFSEAESLELFKKLLTKDLAEDLSTEEVSSSRALLKSLGGLPLAIQQIASLINQRGKSDTAVTDFFALYERNKNRFHEKPNEKVDYSHNLATVWRMAFEKLKANAHALLGVISFVSPDVIPQDLFQPRNKEVLKPCMKFCEDEFEQAKFYVTHIADPRANLFSVDEALEELLRFGLISRQGRILSIHRLVQEAFAFNLKPEQMQIAFDATVSLLYEAFPNQIAGRPMYREAHRSQAYIQHSTALTMRFKALVASKAALEAPVEFFELLRSCTWYHYENSNLPECISLVNIGLDFFPATLQGTMLSSRLHNAAGSAHFEMNNLKQSHYHFEITRKIRETLVDPDDPETEEELGNIYNNIGVVLSAEGNLHEALESFDRSRKIKLGLGKGSEVTLILYYMNAGRTLLLQDELDQGQELYDKAMAIIIEHYGDRSLIYAHLLHFFGNLYMRRHNIKKAQQYYLSSLDLLNEVAPSHVVISSVHYKLAHIAWECKQPDSAFMHLWNGYGIAEARNSRGEMARVLRKQAQILAETALSPSQEKDAETLRTKAEILRVELQGPDNINDDDSLAAYDLLVCGYHRF